MGGRGPTVVALPDPSAALLAVPSALRSLECLGGWVAQGPRSTPSLP